MAVALVATGTVGITTHRASVLEVVAGDRTELALVDVCVSASRHVASRALWRPELITELYCTFAEPDGIGLSSVPGLLRARVTPRTASRCDSRPWTARGSPCAPRSRRDSWCRSVSGTGGCCEPANSSNWDRAG
jgi:hypothetical protein